MRSSDGDFGASDVGLSTVELEAFVKRDELGSDEVVSGGQIGGDFPVQLAEVRSKLVNAPLLGRLVVAVLEYFEPDRSTSGLRLRHIDDAGSSMIGRDDVGIRSSHAHFVMKLRDHARSGVDGALLVGSFRRRG